MSYSRVGIVTGANKGIGLAIVRQLALQYPNSPLNDGKLLIYLTARDEGRGEAAVQEIRGDSQIKQAKALVADGGLSDIKYHSLDITDSNSMTAFTEHLREAHNDGVDFVINNAAIAMQGFDLNVVKTTLDCNYYKTLDACHAFLPLIKPGGRLTNIASTAGKLSRFSDKVKHLFLAAKTEEDITGIMQNFASAVEAGNEKDAGFPSAAYMVSKAGLIGATRALALAEKEKGSSVLINSCCPGYVKTDMTKGGGNKTPDEGAQTPVMLSLENLNKQMGTFWHNEKHEEW